MCINRHILFPTPYSQIIEWHSHEAILSESSQFSSMKHITNCITDGRLKILRSLYLSAHSASTTFNCNQF